MDHVESVKRYHAALNAFDFAAIEKMFGERAEYHSPGVGSLYGREAILAAFRRYFSDHSDQVASDDSVERVGTNAVRSRWRLRATAHSTGAVSERRGLETIVFDSNGFIERVEVEDR